MRSKIKKFFIKNNHISFIIDKKLKDVVPEPIPGNKMLPDWYKKVTPYMSEDEFNDGNKRTSLQDSTVKRCAPFMEAMTIGWILRSPAEVRFYNKDDNVQIDWKTSFDVVGSHDTNQLGDSYFSNDDFGVVLKWINPWRILAPKDTRMLFTAPMNREQKNIFTFSGVVDIDSYINNINIPFIARFPENEPIIIPKGYPIAHLIPFNKNSLITDAVVRSETDKEKIQRDRQSEKLNTETSLYRNKIWEPLTGSRNVIEKDNDSSLTCPFFDD
jgi:hypothetical protein